MLLLRWKFARNSWRHNFLGAALFELSHLLAVTVLKLLSCARLTGASPVLCVRVALAGSVCFMRLRAGCELAHASQSGCMVCQLSCIRQGCMHTLCASPGILKRLQAELKVWPLVRATVGTSTKACESVTTVCVVCARMVCRNESVNVGPAGPAQTGSPRAREPSSRFSPVRQHEARCRGRVASDDPHDRQ